MNLVFKKYFWAVKLAGIALLALVIAGGINDWLGAKLFVVPTAPRLDVEAPAGADEGQALGRVAGSEDATAVLRDRRIFDLDPAEDEVAAAPPELPEEPPEETPPTDGELEESALGIDLIGTLVAADQAASMATMQVEGQNKLGWIGTEFLDGRAKIVKIAQRHVVIQEDSRLTVVRMWADKSAGPERPGMQPGRPGIGRPTTPQPPRPVGMIERPSPSDQTQRANRIRDGIKKTGAYDFAVERQMLDAELKDLGKLQSEARVVPHYQNQKYEGFKLVGVRPGSLYRALGIRSGDVVKSVNGTAIDSPNKALELFNQLQNSSAIKVEIERRGQPQTLSYDIQ